jgi:hypothetical protein
MSDDPDYQDDPEEPHWVDDHHYRVTYRDGSRSWLYYTETGWDKTCVEVTDHHPDGTSDAYEAPATFWDSLFGGRGSHK